MKRYPRVTLTPSSQAGSLTSTFALVIFGGREGEEGDARKKSRGEACLSALVTESIKVSVPSKQGTKRWH